MSESLHRPDVSFVIAAYNAQDTLARAIDSALAQTGVTVEVLVIDDCSTDTTVEIAESYAGQPVTLIRQGQNGGPGAARNAGIAAACGDWIAVLDADDAVRPERMRRMLACAKATEAQIVVDNLDVVPMHGGLPQRMFREDDLHKLAILTLADFIQSNIIFRSTFNYGYMKPVFSRRFLVREDLRFDESLKIGEDYMLLASALASGGTCAVEPHSGYIYHIREGSISRVLERHHVDAMLSSDSLFLQRFALGGQALIAQRQRTRSLFEARSFLTLVEEIKKRSIGGVLKTAAQNPRALRHLQMPIAARMRRFMNRTGDNPVERGKALQKGRSS
ncbi:glycosyltransferase family 2 protein [Rhizobium halophytocola]|uniref:Succinoglycan biosynthesis protein ExoO n=1 Tax=Rhizobium halophytocola TaxID=735519 RepID=A0ABS4E4V8_9HYPH|nr:glycosyltransferase family 2 protein [Rhizobium halophytocola]MBP1852958.1 succinoglycan biosynthesis protein ExoO [Rhizobium halophytocola]